MDLTVILQWARQALGLSASDNVTVVDADLSTYANSEISELVALYPCVADTSGNVTLAGMDLANFEEAAGLRTGARYANHQGGNQFTSKATKVKVGPVEEDYANADVATLVQTANDAATRAMMRVACVKAGLAFVPLADLAGFRRSNPGCTGVDFGDGDIDFVIVSPSVNPDFLI